MKSEQALNLTMVPLRYGNIRDCVRANPSEAYRALWTFTHPFGADLLACAETNS